MIGGRKFKIWLVSTCAVLAAFALYKMFGDTGNIQISKPDYKNILDTNGIPVDSNSGRIGQAKVGDVGKASFRTVNPKTRKLERVIGFEKVLHKTGDEWQLDKPYMNVYQENIRCDIKADTGIVEIENLEGAKPSAKQAVMKGNVVVHIHGQGKRSDSFIYLNEVAFDNDRSMLWSKDDITFVSQEAELAGKGMEIVYNNATSRLEFLKIKKVDYLNIKDIVKNADVKTTEVINEPNDLVKSSEMIASAEEPQTEIQQGEPNETASRKEDYLCLFRDNVRIEYKEEVVMADEISITNLMLSQKKEKSKKGQQQSAKSEDNTLVEKKKETNTNSVEKIVQPSQPAVETKGNVIATVKCDGPMIIRPVNAKEYEEIKPAKFKGFNQLNSAMRKTLGERNLLIAEKIKYNIETETADANGQVELVFYPQIQTDTGKQKVPFIIAAAEGAKFSIPDNQAIFFGDVKGVFVKQTDSFEEQNIFYGSKLIADLAEKQESKDVMASSDISHITILGPNVRLESIKTMGETKLSHARLKSERIDYDRLTENIIATGKGKIEYSNTAQNLRQSSGKNKLDKPCFTLAEGFTKLVWDTNTMHVRATSDETAGIHIGYLPVLETGYGPRTTVDTKQIDIDYYEPTAGRTELKKLVASGGIVYHEQGGNEFAGKELNYDAIEEYMTVNGSEEMPCMLNGVFADGIEYNLKTGTANAVLGSGVGIMPVKE
ncbi:MAG: hypothetical protein A2Y10_17050 [Planctomycetes bacterium GWF2_41_51]|nr:MAG: hypothetical protein A2Y10_17050 [Planctomycetes bacterium GWF2_41_51]HBG28061.1 hypothetical protein [Phycisphaerales bacterium]